MNGPSTRWALAAVLLLTAAALLASESGQGISAEILGLAKGPVTVAAAPAAELVNLSDPGESPLLPRDFDGQPPMVPHGVVQYLPITPDANECVDCHLLEEKEEGEATPIPSSHYTDLRNEPGIVGDELVGARYNCVQCHVSPGANEALVGNRFRAAP